MGNTKAISKEDWKKFHNLAKRHSEIYREFSERIQEKIGENAIEGNVLDILDNAEFHENLEDLENTLIEETGYDLTGKFVGE